MSLLTKSYEMNILKELIGFLSINTTWIWLPLLWLVVYQTIKFIETTSNYVTAPSSNKSNEFIYDNLVLWILLYVKRNFIRIITIYLILLIVNLFSLEFLKLQQIGLSIGMPLFLIISSISVMLILNPIYALLSLMLVFITTSIFLVTKKIQYLAFVYLVVYVGAISMFFLFVIMLINLRTLQSVYNEVRSPFLEINLGIYIISVIKFFIIICSEIRILNEMSGYNYFVLNKQLDLQYFATYVNLDIGLFADLFYTYYLYLFLLSGVILLISMVGSIVLALNALK